MKSLFGIVLLALLAALVALVLKEGIGTVVFMVPPWRVDLSIGLFVLVSLLLLWLSYWAGRSLQRLASFPERVRSYRERRAELGAYRGLSEALRSLLEGRFVRAERAARDAQANAQVAGLAALVGARAAHRMQEYERRDGWLEKAEGDPELAPARLVASAEMWAEQRDNARALQAIDAMQSAGARHLHAMRIALTAHLQAGHWREAMKIVRTLEKRRALHAEAAARVRRIAVRGMMVDAVDDADALERVWSDVEASDRLDPEIALTAARVLNRVGRGRPAALALEAVLERKWDERLLDEYARCEVPGSRATIERAESWLKEHPRSRPLLLCLARICLRQQLWGKARAYLEDCRRFGMDARTSLAMAELAEAIGDAAEAGRHYREAALGLARSEPEDPAAGLRAVRREATW
jgi:HemY protein